MELNKREVIVVGAGTAGLFAAYFLVQHHINVRLYCNTKTSGRKFLVAGKGGFNLTNSESDELFAMRYSNRLFQEAYKQFNQVSFRSVLSSLGIETYVGTSGRVFPVKSIKPYQVLQSIMGFLNRSPHFLFYPNHELTSLSHHYLTFEHRGQSQVVSIKTPVVFALGGSSWAKTGSTGSWLGLFEKVGIKTKSFYSSNASVCWSSPDIFQPLDGLFLKNVVIYSQHRSVPGEVVFTKKGIEGSPIYALNDQVRFGEMLWMDLKVDLTFGTVYERLKQGKRSISDRLKSIKLSSTAILFLRSILTKEEWNDPLTLAARIKKCPLPVADLAPIDEAISTVGGVCYSDLKQTFELKSQSNWYCIGEMIDWDAPTGGYLIQGCVSSAHVAVNAIRQRFNPSEAD